MKYANKKHPIHPHFYSEIEGIQWAQSRFVTHAGCKKQVLAKLTKILWDRSGERLPEMSGKFSGKTQSCE